MTDPVTVRLLGEPRGKGRPRATTMRGKVRTYTPVETVNYEAALRMAAQVSMGARPILEGSLTVDVVAEFAPPASMGKRKAAQALNGFIRPTKKPDADNIAKMLDALNGVVWRDDAQITTLTVSKRYAERPALTVAVYVDPEMAL